MSDVSYTNEEYKKRFTSGQLDVTVVQCWILGVEPDHYVVSFEPERCTGKSIVPFTIVDRIVDLGEELCFGNGGVLSEKRRAILYLRRPESAEAKALFDIVRTLIANRGDCECGSTGGGGIQPLDYTCKEKASPDGQTRVKVRCKKTIGVTRSVAYIHVPPETAVKLRQSANEFSAAIVPLLLAIGCGAVALAWEAFAVAAFNIGYDTFKNGDGSLDLVVKPASVLVHPDWSTSDIVISPDPVSSYAILTSL